VYFSSGGIKNSISLALLIIADEKTMSSFGLYFGSIFFGNV
jgi:hypothetical protein